MVENKIVGVYNVGSIDACNKYDFVDAVCSNLNIPVELNRVTVEKISCETIRPNYSVLDCAKLQDALAWKVEWRNDLQNYLRSLPSFPEK
jgi:dTDP-4-dehydrorhamnose reductase